MRLQPGLIYPNDIGLSSHTQSITPHTSATLESVPVKVQAIQQWPAPCSHRAL